MPNNRILSLDISSVSTGWAFLNDKDKLSFDFGLIKTDVKEERAKRLANFRKQLMFLLKKFKPKNVVIEDIYSNKNIKTLVILAKFSGVAEECCFSFNNLTPYILHTSKVKSYFKAQSKEDVFNAMISVLEWEDGGFGFKKDNDITDAVAQLIFYYDCIISSKGCKIEKEYGYFYEV